MKNKRNEYFGPMEVEEPVFFLGQHRITVRSEELLRVYSCRAKDFAEEVLIGYGAGEQIIDVPPDTYVRFRSEGRVWVQQTQRDQGTEESTETYATLDRPAPLSPEMRMIQMMMMKNQREREHDRAEMERIRAERLEHLRDRAFEEPGSRPGKKKDGGKPKPGASDLIEPQGDAHRAQADAPGGYGETAAGDDDTEEGDG